MILAVLFVITPFNPKNPRSIIQFVLLNNNITYIHNQYIITIDKRYIKFMGNKRIYILSEEEVKQLYDLPQFSCDEREIFFELNVKERGGLKNLKGTAAKIHFILQLII